MPTNPLHTIPPFPTVESRDSGSTVGYQGTDSEREAVRLSGTQGTDPETTPLHQFYTRLTQNTHVANLPDDFDTFRQALQNPEAREKFHQKLLQNRHIKGVPQNFKQFNTLFTDSQPPTVESREAARLSDTQAAQPEPREAARLSGTQGTTPDDTEDLPTGTRNLINRLGTDGAEQFFQLFQQKQELQNALNEIESEAQQRPVMPAPVGAVGRRQQVGRARPGELADDPEAHQRAENIRGRIAEIDEQLGEFKPGGFGERLASYMGSFVQAGAEPIAGLFDAIALAAVELDDLFGTDWQPGDVSEQSTARMAEWIRNTAEELAPADPTLQDEYISKLAGALGSFMSFAGTGIGAGALRRGAAAAGGRASGQRATREALEREGQRAGAATATGLAAGSGASTMYRDAIEMGASEDDARFAAQLGVIPGTVQVLPVLRVMRRVAGNRGGTLETGWQRAVEALKTGGQEAFVETLGQYGFDKIAQELYDENRDPFQNLFDAGTTAGPAGAITDFLFNSIARRGRGAPRTTPATPPTVESRSAVRLSDTQAGESESREAVRLSDTEGTDIQTLAPEIQFTWDDSAPAEQQIEQLLSERARIQEIFNRESRDDGNPEAAQDAQTAITTINQEIGRLQQQAAPTPTPVQELSPDQQAQQKLEQEVQRLENELTSLREEDGSISDENLNRFNELRKEIITAKNRARRGNNTSHISIMEVVPDGDNRVLTGEDAIAAEAEIEAIIQEGVLPRNIIEDIRNAGYGFNSNDMQRLNTYIHDRKSDAPTIGNNKSPFPQWRRGEQTPTTPNVEEAAAESPAEPPTVESREAVRLSGTEGTQPPISEIREIPAPPTAEQIQQTQQQNTQLSQQRAQITEELSELQSQRRTLHNRRRRHEITEQEFNQQKEQLDQQISQLSDQQNELVSQYDPGDQVPVVDENHTMFRDPATNELVLYNRADGRVVGNTSPNYKPAVAQYVARAPVERIDEQNPDVQSIEEYTGLVADQGQNPAEIMELIEYRTEHSDAYQPVLSPLEDALWEQGGYGVTMQDFRNFADTSIFDGDEGRFFQLRLTGQDQASTSADELASIASETLNREVTAEEVLQSWISYHEKQRPAEQDQVLQTLRQRFRELTGTPYNQEIAAQIQQQQALVDEQATPDEAKIIENITDQFAAEDDFVQKINELAETDPALAEYLTQQPDAQELQQQHQQATQRFFQEIEADPQQPLQQDPQTGTSPPQSPAEQIDPSPPTGETQRGVSPLEGSPAPAGVGRGVPGEAAEPPTVESREAVRLSDAEGTATAEPSAESAQSAATPETFRITTPEQYQQVKDQFNREIAGTVSMGLNPRLLRLGAQIAVYQIEQGARTFSDFVQAMTSELGDRIRPFLSRLYNEARQNEALQQAGIAEQMDSEADVREYERQHRLDIDQRLESEEADRSDYIRRRLQDVRDNPEVNVELESIGNYNVQRVEAANREADALIRDFQSEFGDQQGLLEVFTLLQEGQLPDLMIGPTAEKISLRMQTHGMYSDAVNVIDWLQETARSSARVMRSLRSDASPESTVSRAFAGLEKGKQESMAESRDDGKTYRELFDEILAALQDIAPAGEAAAGRRQQMIDSINEILQFEGETARQKQQRKQAAENIADGYINNESNDQLGDHFADIAGFDQISPEQKQQIMDMATELSGHIDAGRLELAKTKWEELMTYMNDLGLIRRHSSELILDLWYTGVLSGLTTIERSHKGSTITALAHTITKLLGNPEVAPLAITQMIKGFQGSSHTYLHVMKTGRTDVQFADFKPKNPRYTDKLINSKLEDLNLRDRVMKVFYTVPVHMYRTILAWDQVLKQGLSEGYHAVYEYSQAKDANKSHQDAIMQARERLAIEKEAEAKEQAAAEVADMRENGEEVPTGYQARRVREIVRENQDQQFVRRSLEEAARAALVSHPVGTLGQLYQYIDLAITPNEGDPIPVQTAKYMAKGLFPFMRVGINYTNAGLDYTPYGFVRAAKQSIWTRDGIRPVEGFEKREYLLRATIGVSVFSSMLASLFDWDEDRGFTVRPEEDRWLDIVGPATGNWWEYPDISTDFKPWSIRVRQPDGEWSRYYSYIDNPIGFALAPIGIMSDETRFKEFRAEARGRDRAEELRGAQYLMGSGLLGVFRYSMDQSFNQGMNSIGRLFNSEKTETFQRNMYSAFGRPVEGFYPGVYRQIYQQYRGLMDIPEKDANRWYERIARSAPFADAIIKDLQYDVFGYPVIREFNVPLIPEALLKQAKENLNYRETIPEWQLIHKYDQVTVGNFLPPLTHDGKRLTHEQQNEYVQEAGLIFRDNIQRRYNRLDRLEPLELQKELNRLKARSARRARTVILDGRGRRLSDPRPTTEEDDD